MENDNNNDNNILVNQEISVNDSVVNQGVENNLSQNTSVDEINNDNNLDEKKKKNIKFVIFIILFVVILIGIGIYGLFMINKEEDSGEVGNNDNSGNIDDDIIVPTYGDDNNEENNEENDVNVDIEENIIYIYQKGYAEKGPIAFTYECKSDICDLKVTDKGFILYDNDIVKYREMTSYEYEQINNSDVTPIGSKLDMDGFAKVKSVYDGSDEIYHNYFHDVYYIDGELYQFKSDDVQLILIDDEIMLYSGNENIVYNLKLKKVLIGGEPDYVVHKKVNDFYIFVPEYSDSYYIICNNTKELVSFHESSNYYVNEDKIYYIENNKVNVVNTKGEIIEYNNNGIEAIQILDDKLLYLNSDNVLCIKNLLNDEVYRTNIKMKNATYLFDVDDSVIELYEKDYTIIENDDFDSFKNKQSILDDEINQIKSCVKNDSECDFVKLGYKITLDKDGKFISKEYYYNSY